MQPVRRPSPVALGVGLVGFAAIAYGSSVGNACGFIAVWCSALSLAHVTGRTWCLHQDPVYGGTWVRWDLSLNPRTLLRKGQCVRCNAKWLRLS